MRRSRPLLVPVRVHLAAPAGGRKVAFFDPASRDYYVRQHLSAAGAARVPASFSIGWTPSRRREPSMATKYVYSFGDGYADGDAKQKELLGGKGANLAEMCKIGLPVPAGYTLTTDVCTYFYANGRKYPPDLKKQVEDAMDLVEKTMGSKYGDPKKPLLLACRSGARESMPGMMDTVLNIGLNDETVKGLIEQSGDERFAYDSYRRLVQMY